MKKTYSAGTEAIIQELKSHGKKYRVMHTQWGDETVVTTGLHMVFNFQLFFRNGFCVGTSVDPNFVGPFDTTGQMWEFMENGATV